MNKKAIMLIVMGVLILSGAAWAGGAPKTLAGFELGRDVVDFSDLLRMDTELPVRHLESLKEVEIKDAPGFKSGLVYYATCAGGKPVVRLKLKCADSSEKFFENMLAEYRKKFGAPDEWRGDPFRIVVAWKWSFTDENGDRIGLIIQHNKLDEEEKKGNSIKLTNNTLMEKEFICFEARQPKEETPKKHQKEKVGWETYIPR
jgi:hypothetical protein